jgi:hypothetical protein
MYRQIGTAKPRINLDTYENGRVPSAQELELMFLRVDRYPAPSVKAKRKPEAKAK